MTAIDTSESGANSAMNGQLTADSIAHPPAREDALQRGMAIRNSVGLASETEMAAILQVSEETLATWRSKKRGPPSIKLGKKVFYLITDFSQWVMAEVQKQAQPAAKRARVYKPVVHVDENQPGMHLTT